MEEARIGPYRFVTKQLHFYLIFFTIHRTIIIVSFTFGREGCSRAMGKRILLVDDEPLILKGLKYTLEQEGYETDSAMDGEEALAKFFAQPYDMILLDVMLPKLDGIAVCQRIREHSNVPIIMLTAKGEDMDKILGL